MLPPQNVIGLQQKTHCFSPSLKKNLPFTPDFSRPQSGKLRSAGQQKAVFERGKRAFYRNKEKFTLP